MPRLFVANIDFEHELASRPRTEIVERLRDELAAIWVTIAEPGDLIWCNRPVDPEFIQEVADAGFSRAEFVTDAQHVPSDYEVCPWGAAEGVGQWAKQNNWRYEQPAVEIVRELNSRRFSFALEREFGCGLREAAAIHSIDELFDATKSCGNDERWVVKADLGMSARERTLGRGPVPGDNALNWVHKQLVSDGVVFFEPWVERIAEVGLQFTVFPNGEAKFEGVTELLTAGNGAYRGSRFAHDAALESEWSSAIDEAMHAAQRMSERGYFGPLGIDALRYRDRDGEIRTRPLQDINARFTMGRLSLGLRRILRPNAYGSWLHLPSAAETDAQSRQEFGASQALAAPAARLIHTSPYVVGDRPVRHVTLAVLAGSREELLKAESSLLNPRSNTVLDVDR